MRKTEIFEEVVQIVKHDASFCKDNLGADAEQYRAKISDDMDEEEFLYLVQSYLASFHVKAHLHFYREDRDFFALRVMRYENALYVIDTAPNAPLTVGDKIVEIDGHSVEEYAALHRDMLHGEPPERQGFSWRKLLTFAKELLVVHPDGTEARCPVPMTNEWDSGEKYFCKQLRDNVAYLRLADFGDDIAIAKMYQENDELLRNSEYLVIDVRENGGGNDSAYQPLLKYCLPEGKGTDSLEDGCFDGEMEINYSPRNCDARLARFESILKQDIPADTRAMLSNMVKELKENYGKGFVVYRSASAEEKPSSGYMGTALPKRVFLLTDEDCGSSGDAFVDTMRKSPIVTVVGRPTMGILDYSNCTATELGDYRLIYPTSRNRYLDKGVQMRGHGIPVDVFVPWTPKHLERDVDLDTALALIDEQQA